MTVTITDTGATARVVRVSGNGSSGQQSLAGQAGTLTPSNSETQVICEDDRNAPCRSDAPLQFIEHSLAKSGNTYEFDWTPPAGADAGPVRFYVAANAANGNGQNTGDRIFTANITLTPGGASSGPKPAIQSSNGVQNGATFENNMVAGSWTTIKGTDLAQNTRIWLGSDFVNGAAPTELDGVKVNIDGKPAAVYFISPTQINVQAPDLGGKTGNVASRSDHTQRHEQHGNRQRTQRGARAGSCSIPRTGSILQALTLMEHFSAKPASSVRR